MVVTHEVYVGDMVSFDVEEAAVSLSNDEACGGEEDGKDADPVVQMMFKFVNGPGEVDFLLCEPLDFIAVDASSTVGRVERQGDGVRCVGHHVGGLWWHEK